MMTYNKGQKNAQAPPRSTYVHPGPKALRMMSMIATRAAPMDPRTRLFCAWLSDRLVKRQGVQTQAVIDELCLGAKSIRMV